MIDSVKPNSVSISSADFEFLINPNRDKKVRYTGIVSNMLDIPSQRIFSANQVHAASHFYYYKPRKLGVKKMLVTTDSREIRMFISDELAYIPIILPTDENMEYEK